ncbi:MAG TPA: DUF4280 domain-containing protein [Byssovorax sp.]
MKKLVLLGAKLKCSQGTSPSSLAISTHGTSGDASAVATVDDFAPMTNVMPFGMCQTQANPQVAAATAAALGVLTPQPCVPVITSPWSPGSSVVTVEDVNALTDDSTCSCSWTGSISVSDAASSGLELD